MGNGLKYYLKNKENNVREYISFYLPSISSKYYEIRKKCPLRKQNSIPLNNLRIIQL